MITPTKKNDCEAKRCGIRRVCQNMADLPFSGACGV